MTFKVIALLFPFLNKFSENVFSSLNERSRADAGKRKAEWKRRKGKRRGGRENEKDEEEDEKEEEGRVEERRGRG